MNAVVDAYRDADGNIIPTAEHLAAVRAEHPGLTDTQARYVAGFMTISRACLDFVTRRYAAESP
jgi:hypothetical protein